MFQSLAQFCIALAEFFKQAYIFDCDNGLVGEGFEQSDLFFREWPDFSPSDIDTSYRKSFSQ